MISIVRQFSNNVTLSHEYKFAGQTVVFSEPVHSLASFQAVIDERESLLINDLPLNEFELFSQFELLTANNSELCYQGHAQFDQKMRSIDYWRIGDVAQIDVDGIPSCRLHFKANCIVILNEYSFDTPFNLELITGPALILLFAQESLFCLHSGSISFSSTNNKSVNVAFLADSGVGKSTLSKAVEPFWSQLSDDILPIQIGERVRLFNDFPQLKLPQARAQQQELKNNNLDYVICLDASYSDEIVIEKVQPVQSVLAIVRHTIASRLFDHELLRKHCVFAQLLSQKVPTLRISYPRDYAQLPELRNRIVEYLS